MDEGLKANEGADFVQYRFRVLGGSHKKGDRRGGRKFMYKSEVKYNISRRECS